jgi:hypothetical protein
MYWEIVTLEDGQIALREAGGEKEPMVLIRFSDEAKGRLQGNDLEVARIMLTAGIHAVAAMDEEHAAEGNDADGDSPRRSDQPLH